MFNCFRRKKQLENSEFTPSMRVDLFEQGRKNPYSLGNLAIKRGYITAEDLEEALKVQKQRLKLGQILLEMDKITENQLTELLLEQDILEGRDKSQDAEVRLAKLRRRNRLISVRDKFAEARGSAEEMTASVNLIVLQIKSHNG